MTSKKTARVFPTKTKMSPDDQHAYFGYPPFREFLIDYDEVHISVTFTWDIKRGYELKTAWEQYFDNVKIGGPAIGDCNGIFTPGMYLKNGYIITSRGCPYNCKKYCFVHEREGGIKELPVFPGNKVQDNNLLACSKEHRDEVFYMLDGQKDIEFKGGLDSRLMTHKIAHRLKSLCIKRLWFSCDYDAALKPLEKAVGILQKVGFTREHLYCYALSFGKDMDKDEERYRKIWDIGCIPYCQLFQPKSEKRIEYPKEWQRFQRKWLKVPIIRSRMKKAT